MKTTESGAIVLLEEPESFISPASQIALGAALAKFASENKFTIIFTSHSESLVSRLSAKNLVINIPDSKGHVNATIAENPHEHLRALRLQPKKEGMVMCEDWGAVAFLRGILKRESHFALSRFDFVPAFSESNVARLLEFYPHRVGATPIFGVLDGDVRNSFAYNRLKWPHCFLPGDVAPEKILIDTLVNNVDAFCSKFRLSRRNVDLAIASTQGMDYHDFIAELVSSLPCSHEDIVNFVIDLLYDVEDWSGKFTEFMTQFESCFPKGIFNP
ncbi:ABC transporter ATP-binding protein [Burkholderia ubonensis]|uniref:ABC transporter ATP-binding protein n=1 Tax=Burkholderia ubonensis TaxID=101571 RepID=UPI002AAF6F22|nr:ABC transporter ATP-binding protein [Burkholderia ubonensis]